MHDVTTMCKCSSAELFSSLKLIKTEHWNSLKRESGVGLLRGKEGMASMGTFVNELNLQDHPRLLKHLRNVKSNPTDRETHKITRWALMERILPLPVCTNQINKTQPSFKVKVKFQGQGHI